jgi:hypothetical protein
MRLEKRASFLLCVKVLIMRYINITIKVETIEYGRRATNCEGGKKPIMGAVKKEGTSARTLFSAFSPQENKPNGGVPGIF